MKLWISIVMLMFAGNVAAQEVHLICEGSSTVCDEKGGCDSVDVIREVSFNETAGDFSYRRNGKDWKTKDIKFSLSRYTGVLTTDPKVGGGMTLQCKRVAEEKLF